MTSRLLVIILRCPGCWLLWTNNYKLIERQKLKSPPAGRSAADCSHFRTHPSCWPYLALLTISCSRKNLALLLVCYICLLLLAYADLTWDTWHTLTWYRQTWRRTSWVVWSRRLSTSSDLQLSIKQAVERLQPLNRRLPRYQPVLYHIVAYFIILYLSVRIRLVTLYPTF